MGWTEDEIKTLERLWDEGVTTTEIGNALGKTKNAVVGKAHRLKLSPRPSPIKRVRSDNKDSATGAKQKTSRQAKEASAKKLIEAKKRRGPVCQWPFGHPDEDDFHFCLKPVAPSKPYCAEHCAIAYVPPTRKGEQQKLGQPQLTLAKSQPTTSGQRA